MTSAFQRGNAVGGNIAGAFNNVAEKSALDTILENAANTNDPNVITDTMSKILNTVSDPQKRQAVQNMLEFKYKGAVERQKQQREAQEKERGRQARIQSGFQPDLEVPLAQEAYKRQNQENLLGRLGLGEMQPGQQGQMGQPVLPQQQAPQEQMQPGISQQQPQPIQTPQPAQKPAASNLSEDQIAVVSVLNPMLGRVLQDQKTAKEKQDLNERKLAQRQKEQDLTEKHRQQQFELSKKQQEETEKHREAQMTQSDKHHWDSTTGKWVSTELDKLAGIEKQEEAANQILATVDKVSGPVNRTFLAEKMGKGYEWLKSTEGNIVEAGKKAQFAGAKETFPGRVTDRDTVIFEQGLVGIGKNKAANNLIIKQEISRLKIHRARIEEMRKILKKTPYLPEFQLREQIEENVKPLIDREYNAWRKQLYEAAGTPLEKQETRSAIQPDTKQKLDQIFKRKS